MPLLKYTVNLSPVDHDDCKLLTDSPSLHTTPPVIFKPTDYPPGYRHKDGNSAANFVRPRLAPICIVVSANINAPHPTPTHLHNIYNGYPQIAA